MFQLNEHGVSIICDSWTGLTHMSVIYFFLFSNGRIWSHKSVDATSKSEDAKFLLKVTIICDSSTYLHVS
jgi:hypothetical protein